MKDISEMNCLKQEQQPLPLFCTRLKYLEIYEYEELTSKEINEVEDVFQASLNKIQYLKFIRVQNITAPYKSPLKTAVSQILNSFINLRCLTIKFKFEEETFRDFDPQEYPKDEQLESDIKQWLADNTCLKDIHKFYTDYIDDDGLKIFM